MMRSVRFVVIFLIICSCVFAVPAAAIVPAAAAPARGDAFALTADEREYLDSIRDRTIVLGTTSGLMSFTGSDGNPAGMLLPVLNLLENDFGLTVKTEPTGWGDMYEKLDDGSIDLFGLAISSEERRKRYYATDVLYVSGLDVYTRVDDPLGSLINLENKNIACVVNSTLPKMISEYIKPSTVIKYYSRIDDMLSALEDGEVDCVFVSLTIQAELLNHPGVEFEMRVNSVRASQCLYSGNPELERLIEIINRYIRSASGEKLLSDINESRGESIIKAARTHFDSDIRHLRDNYERLRVYDSGVLYPLSYMEDGVYKGFHQDINDVFLQLTGMPIETCRPSEFEEGFITAADMIRRGELVGAASVHRNSAYLENSGFSLSMPIMSDHLRIYSLTGDEQDLSKLKIGTTRNAAPYVDWMTHTGQQPVIFGDRSLLVSALRRGEIDAVFFGEMSADYYYTVQKDYALKQVGSMSVATAYYMMMSVENVSFNKLFNESVKLQRMLYPGSHEAWTNVSRNDKFAFMRLQSRISGYQTVAITAGVIIFIIMIAFLYGLRYQNKRFSTYDRQITLMLTTQKNADMLWGNTATGRIVSKGNFPIYRDWDLNNYPDMPLHNAVVEEGILEDVKRDLKEIGEKNLPYSVAERVYHPAEGEGDYYLRRYTHKISEHEFMVFALDVTDEKQREAVLSELASTDFLSKLRNRRAMQEILSDKAAGLADSGARLFVMMVDVDDFKNVNDSYGHQIGDSVLVGLAKTLNNIDPSCVAARWGGEEFLIAAEVANPENALEIAENIRAEVSRVVFPVGTRTSFSVTVSCGVSELFSEDDIDKAVSRADSAMYAAKKAGKNRVMAGFD